MKTNPGFQLTSHQLMFFIIGAIVGTGILSLPRTISAEAEQDAWIAVILGVAAPFIALFILERLCRRFPNLTIVEMANLLFGRWIGSILVLGYIAYIIFMVSVIVRNISEFTSLYLLPVTPKAVTIFVIISANIYIAAKGAKVLGRINQLLFYILLLALLFLIIPIFMSDFTNILPVGTSGIKGILKGTVITAFSYAGVETLFVIYPMVTQKKKVFKIVSLALLISTLIYLVVTVASILVFGAEPLQRIIFPLIMLLKVMDIPIVERLELFFLALWTGLAMRPVVNYSFTASFCLTQLFKLDVKKFYPIIVCIVSLIIYVIALIQQNITVPIKLADYVGYSFFVIALGYPVLFYIAVFIRKGVVNKNG